MSNAVIQLQGHAFKDITPGITASFLPEAKRAGCQPISQGLWMCGFNICLLLGNEYAGYALPEADGTADIDVEIYLVRLARSCMATPIFLFDLHIFPLSWSRCGSGARHDIPTTVLRLEYGLSSTSFCPQKRLIDSRL
jgi:hypothetical protein